MLQESDHMQVFPISSRHRKEEEKKSMSILELFLLAVGLSMDAFAVSSCKSLAMRPMN